MLGVFEDKTPTLTAAGKYLDAASGQQLSAALGAGGLAGELGDVHMLHAVRDVKAERVLLVGLGPRANFSASAARRAAAATARFIDKRGLRAADLCLLEADYGEVDSRRRTRHLVEAMGGALYRYQRTKSGPPRQRTLARVAILCERAQLAAVKRGVAEGGAIAGAVTLAREYANLPGNLCTPTYLAKQALALGKRLDLKTTILSEADMKRHKMGALLSVSRGSREAAKLIIMEYSGGAKKAAPVVLVGKGLTFDAGGISIKPAAAMDEMKYDMCGGASVFGAMQAAAELRLKINVVGLVPSSENMPDGAANKPGDIVTSMSGATIEILNTDAEGRLILCDAMTYAERFKPAAGGRYRHLDRRLHGGVGATRQRAVQQLRCVGGAIIGGRRGQRRPRLAAAGVGRIRQTIAQ